MKKQVMVEQTHCDICGKNITEQYHYADRIERLIVGVGKNAVTYKDICTECSDAIQEVLQKGKEKGEQEQ